MSSKRKATEIEIEEIDCEDTPCGDIKSLSSDDEAMDDDFGSDGSDSGSEGDNYSKLKRRKTIKHEDKTIEGELDDEDGESEDSAQYDEEESDEETSSDEEGVDINSSIKGEKEKVVRFDSAKTIRKREKLAKAGKKLTNRELVEKKREKIMKLKMKMVKPDYARDRAKEKTLAKIASFGVATLFNEVLEHKKRVNEETTLNKEVKALDIDRKYQAQLDALPRTANRFPVRRQKEEV